MLQSRAVSDFEYGGAETRTFSQVEEAKDLDHAGKGTSSPKNPSPNRFFCNPSARHRSNRGPQKRCEGIQAHGHPSLLWFPCVRNHPTTDLAFM